MRQHHTGMPRRRRCTVVVHSSLACCVIGESAAQRAWSPDRAKPRRSRRACERRCYSASPSKRAASSATTRSRTAGKAPAPTARVLATILVFVGHDQRCGHGPYQGAIIPSGTPSAPYGGRDSKRHGGESNLFTSHKSISFSRLQIGKDSRFAGCVSKVAHQAGRVENWPAL